MIVAGIQIEVRDGDIAYNIQNAYKYVRMLYSATPDIIILPELWCCGYLEDYSGIKQEIALEAMTRFSRLTKSLVIGSVPWQVENRTYNRAFAIHNGQIIAYYDKIHPFKPFGEDKVFTPGTHLSIFRFKGVRIGLAICYDLRFTELIRQYAINGADLIISPSAWGKPRLHQWRTVTGSQASINQVYLVAVNRTGKGVFNESFAGHSIIVDPWGDVIVEAGESEGIILGEINVEEIDKARKRLPVLEDYKEKRNVYSNIKFFNA
jgi:omega-amidase